MVFKLLNVHLDTDLTVIFVLVGLFEDVYVCVIKELRSGTRGS